MKIIQADIQADSLLLHDNILDFFLAIELFIPNVDHIRSIIVNIIYILNF